MKGKKATCSECGRKLKLTKDGTIHTHLRPGYTHDIEPYPGYYDCDGSGLAPAPDAEG